MENKFRKIALNYYSDILKNIDYINSWKDLDTFNIKNLESHQLEKLKKINIVEFEYTRNSITKEDFYDLFDNYNLLFHCLMKLLNKNAFVIITEHMKSIPNRVRTYKGLLSKREKENANFLQFESHFIDGYSLLIAIVELSENNLSNFFNTHLFDSDCTFIYFTNNNEIFTESYLKELTFEKMNHKNVSKIDYTKILIDLKNDDIILRVSGNEGETNLGLQLFFNNCQLENIKEMVLELENKGFTFKKNKMEV